MAYALALRHNKEHLQTPEIKQVTSKRGHRPPQAIKKMQGPTVPDADVHASEATLGTVAASNLKSRCTKLGTSPGTNLVPWQRLFHTLPTELHVNIMAHLDQDPASQICFGLTSRYFYWQVFHEVRDEREYGSERKVYRHPNDLRLQVSVCGQYSVYGWWEYGFLLDAWHVGWNRSLGELLFGEWWLWGDLRYCEECVRYKPESAFEEFEGQQELLQGVANRQVVVDDLWLGNVCKRCRSKQLLRDLGEREEIREQSGNPWEERKSLGLRKLEFDGNAKEMLQETGYTWTSSRLWEEREALESNYETWESIFSKLGI